MNLDESSIPAIPTTLFFGKPEYFCRAITITSNGFVIQITKALGEVFLNDSKIQLSLGINNVTDEKAPLVFDASNWAYDPKHHDARGKMMYIGIKLTR